LGRKDAPAKVTMIDPKHQTEGYCQFSGGGDIFLDVKQQEILVVNRLIEGDDVEGFYLIHDGTSLATTMSIEGKRGDFDYEKLKYRLFANIMRTSITKFVNEIQDYDEAAIQKVTQITGYGIPFIGFGNIGFYKLQIEFGKQTKFITKIQLNQYPQPYAAGLIDYLLEY